MSTVRYINTITRCVRCQRHTLNGFLSLAGLTLTTKPHRLHPELHQPFQRRYLTNDSTSITPNNDTYIQQPPSTDETQLQPIDPTLSSPENDTEPLSEVDESLNPPDNESSETPWYLLDAESDQSPIYRPIERQRLPEIPPGAPQKFSTILKHLSIDIGLDYIQLIDLRPLDPPPALGAGVMMLIGTARSEKHLHVSADRLARWLRSTYKLSVNADGLLGRNELKLQMKRKAKRAKLLGSVGAVQKEGEEEMNKSGWICVDAGVIEQGVVEERSLDEEGIIGFGGRTDGVKLVVQIMTEDKRREIDLETLWGRALERHWKRVAARDAADVVVDAGQDDVVEGAREESADGLQQHA